MNYPSEKLKVTIPKTEYKNNPIGLGNPQPRLSWEILSAENNVKQTAFQYRVAESLEKLNESKALLWNSGKVFSEESVQVKYEGPALHSGQRIYWQVKVWDNKGNESEWCEPSYWEMGLLDSSDWQASWIEPAYTAMGAAPYPSPHLRKEFRLEKDIAKARIYVSSKGLYQLFLNGEKVGDELFTPGWTPYHKRIQYQVYDVTRQLKNDHNAIGAILGDGWYRGELGWQDKRNYYGGNLALILQLEVIYEDGSKEIILTDDSWKSSEGPILKSELYDGEIYDARRELTGWDESGYEDGSWSEVKVKDDNKDILTFSEGEPVRITKTVKPVRKFIAPNGKLVFDMGQNMVGWIEFTLHANEGNVISLKHGEVLDQDGNVYFENLRKADQLIRYTFKGDRNETYEPHFTFMGFRYVMVEDYPFEIGLEDIAGKVIHSDMTFVGDFECSDSLINRLQKNIQWGLRGNFLDVPTDCPQRDERMGWTGDAQVFAPTACFNVNAASFYTRWLKDLALEQKSDGSVPWVVPNVLDDGGGTGWSDGFGATGWADAAIIIPWEVYKAYGDKRILEEQYPSMKAWLDYMIEHSGEKSIFDYGFHFGDWLSFAEYYSYKYNAPDYGYAGAHTEKALIATAYFYHSTSLMHKIANVIGKDDDKREFTELMPKIKAAFQHEFITASGRLVSGTQTAYAMALAFNLLPEEMKEIASNRLAEDVEHFGHLTTGFLGTPILCHALTENGYPDLAYMLLFNKRYPSWLFPVTMGATTIWERWDGIKPDGSFQNPGMNSFNHYAYGAIGHWLYSAVAGINPDPEQPGFKHVIIKPYPDDRLNFARATHHSMYGEILSGWEKIQNGLKMNVSIPANTNATIAIPVNDAGKVYKDGILLNEIPGIEVAESDEGVMVEVGSGEYEFIIRENV